MTTGRDPADSVPWHRAARVLLSLNEVPWRWSAGTQAGVALGVPLALFTLAGHQSLGLIASLGAFTALYCPTLSAGDRLLALPLVAAGFAGAAALGVLCAPSAGLTIVCLTVVAALACVISFGVGLGPPGPMQFVLVAGIGGHMAAPASLGGGAIDGRIIPLLVAAGAIGAYLLMAAPFALPAIRRRAARPVGLRAALPTTPLNRQARIIAARVVVAVAVAGLLSLPLGVHRAYWVVMVAGAVLQASYSLRPTAIRAAQRVLGTFLGLAVYGLVALVEPGGLWLVLIIALLHYAVEVVIARNYGLGLVFITPIALTITREADTAVPLVLAGERIADTLLGAAVAMAVLWISRRIQSAHLR